MIQFHETGYGRKFFNHEIPELNKNLNRIADALEKLAMEKEKVEIENEFDNISFLKSIKIDKVFSIRVYNSLTTSRNPKYNLFELVQSSETELLRNKHFGVKCLWEVTEFLKSMNLDLDMSIEQIEAAKLKNHTTIL
jgi:DNA-directed RNA polymerase alpha subunit